VNEVANIKIVSVNTKSLLFEELVKFLFAHFSIVVAIDTMKECFNDLSQLSFAHHPAFSML